jgi:hypothetical protein
MVPTYFPKKVRTTEKLGWITTNPLKRNTAAKSNRIPEKTLMPSSLPFAIMSTAAIIEPMASSKARYPDIGLRIFSIMLI